VFSRGYSGSGLALAHRLGWYLGRGVKGFLSQVHDSFHRGYRSSAATPQASNRPTSSKERPFLTLMLVVVPLAVVAAVGPREWFLNWPALFAGAFLLVVLLRGPLSGIHRVGKKIVRLGISICLLYGFWLLLNWKPLWGFLEPFGVTRNRAGFRLILVAIIVWWVTVFWIIFSRGTARKAAIATGSTQTVSPRSPYPPSNEVPAIPQPQVSPRVPLLCFADLGGLEDEKQQIRDLVESRMQPGKYTKYGVVRNGILLYGPPGSGKTFLAEATAGEFALPFRRVLASDLVSMWMGDTEKRIHTEFEDAAAQAPVLLFFDEVDSLVTTRQPLGTGGDPGGAGRSFNSATTTFMEMMTKYRDVPGLVLMLATNKMEGLDEAVVREGRIDLEIRVDLPNQAMRLKILEKQLENRPWRRFDLKEFAQKTAGTSPAKIRALVDKAATFAAAEGRRIEESDLRRAFEQSGGKDRQPFEPVEWSDLVLEEDVESDVRMLVRLLNEPGLAKKMQVPISTGVLLVGPTGTGKTTIARLIATQSNRSFYQITPADILGRYTGDSVKQIAGLFSRAKGHSPSLIFIDELDALLPQANASLGQHDVQVVDQFLIEISSLQAENRVFLVGATNRPEGIDPRVLRGGRFSEKIKVGLPGRNGRDKLLLKYLGPVRLEAGLEFGLISGLMDGFAPADLKAICDAAKRLAFMRAQKDQPPPPLSRADFEGAIERVRGFA
jgi:SpoVK/Ycf46/Vps4 family AAA+-type ATPase